MKKYILILCTSIVFWLSAMTGRVFAHVLIPPQFKNYVIEHPHATVAEVQKVIDDRWTMADIEWLSWMTSTELATRLLVSFGSGESSLLSQYTSITWNVTIQDKPVASLSYYIAMGIRHILSWRDHILYVISLLLLITSWRKLIVWLSLFTVAHSCTLALMVLWWIVFPSQIAEIIIALSIVTSSAWFLWKWNKTSSNTLILYITILWFGLFHGLWFANVFTELQIVRSQLLIPLLWFNIGVEIGQVVIVVIWSILLWMLVKYPKISRVVQKVIARVVCLLGMWWVIERMIG